LRPFLPDYFNEVSTRRKGGTRAAQNVSRLAAQSESLNELEICSVQTKQNTPLTGTDDEVRQIAWVF
jgi:isopentenyldiphosphate isomerase